MTCVVETIGRRSGKHHEVVLPYWLDDDNQRIVVASYQGGPRNPAWFHNLVDKSANPTVKVTDRFGDLVERRRGGRRRRVRRALGRAH